MLIKLTEDKQMEIEKVDLPSGLNVVSTLLRKDGDGTWSGTAENNYNKDLGQYLHRLFVQYGLLDTGHTAPCLSKRHVFPMAKDKRMVVKAKKRADTCGVSHLEAIIQQLSAQNVWKPVKRNYIYPAEAKALGDAFESCGFIEQ